jgi:hypothetical protein
MADESTRPVSAVPATVQWFQAILTAVLALLAALQVIFIVPACVYVAGHLRQQQPEIIDALLTVPPALVWVAALALAGMAFWQRHSAHRSALLATLAVSINVGLQLCIFASLFHSLRV